jgi:hypothetical protein
MDDMLSFVIAWGAILALGSLAAVWTVSFVCWLFSKPKYRPYRPRPAPGAEDDQLDWTDKSRP